MLYNHVESCVRNLKSLKLDTSGYSPLLIPILKDRLPDEITMIISRKFGEKIWTLDKVMEHFNSELRAQKNCSAATSNRFGQNESPKKGGGVIIVPVVYLVRPIRFHVCIVVGKGTHYPNALAFLITSLGRLFSVEIRGVSYVWLLDTLPKIVSPVTYAGSARLANTTSQYVNLHQQIPQVLIRRGIGMYQPMITWVSLCVLAVTKIGTHSVHVSALI